MDTRHPSRCWVAALILILALLTTWLGRAWRKPSADPGVVRKGQIAAAYGALPLAFEPGDAEASTRPRYTARGTRGSVEITPAGLVVRPRTQPGKKRHGALGMRLLGTRGAKSLRGERNLPGKVHYLRGRDPRGWQTNVPTYAAVRGSGVYPGIDVVYYGRGTELEYDFVVAPSADPAAIRLAFENSDSARLNANGDLVLDCGTTQVLHCRPMVYQEASGQRNPVEASYELQPGTHRDEVQVSFRLGDYDRSQPLIIDPILIYSTYFGGTGVEMSRGAGIALDESGNAYLVGDTDSPSLPNAGISRGGGIRDAFVTKLNSTGTAVLYTTYLGGSDSDVAHGITVDQQGNAYVVGETFSRDFPVVNALQPVYGGTPFSDAFVVKLDPSGGSLRFGTYLGGRSGSDIAAAVALDASGNPWIAGSTNAANFPTQSPVQPFNGGGYDAFVTGLSASGHQILASTYLGGSGNDRGRGIAVSPGGAVSVCGGTDSANFPLLNAVQFTRGFSQDAFVAQLAAGGAALAFSTYLGGDGPDVATSVAADPTDGSIIAVTGYTGSINFPVAHAYQDRAGGRGDAFVAKLSPNNRQLIYSTYLGGNGTENLTLPEQGAVTLDAQGSAYITGVTASRNFPVIGAAQKRSGGLSDAFVARLSPDGTRLLYSTYLGGKKDDAGLAIAVDPIGNAFVAGQTNSTDLPLRNPAQRAAAGNGDAFIAKLGNVSADTAPILVLSDKTLDFGTVAAKGGFLKLRLANGGRGKLLCLVTDPEAPFQLLVGGGQFTIARGKSKTLYVQFKPTAAGEYEGVLMIETNDPYYPTAQISLHGVMPEAP